MKFIRYPMCGSVSKKSVLTIGNFDGVHKGHQALINQVTKFAKNNGLESIVVSMQPLATQYFAGKENIAILTPFKCKYELIKDLQVDTFCVLNFNKALSEISAEEFIQNILLDSLMAKHIIIGDDFKFGKNRQGDYQLLKNYCHTKNVSVASIDSISDKSIRVSSSAIRYELSQGNFDTVKSYLGRRFSIAGKISRGQQIGRTLDFPTINIKLTKRVLPLNGIFCVKVAFKNGEIHLGSASIGTRPTVNGKGIVLEVHLLDFNKQVYGQNVEVFFYHKIRNEVKFEGLEELKRHIKQDVIKTRLFFNSNT